MAEYTVEELARRLGRQFSGDGAKRVRRFATIDRADHLDDLTFALTTLPSRRIEQSGAGVLLTTSELWERHSSRFSAAILTDDPYGDMERLMVEVYRHPLEGRGPEVAPSAQAHSTAVIEGVVEDGAVIGPLCWIGRGARVGARCRLEAGVKIYPGADIGAESLLLANAVVGSRGFGFRTGGDGKQILVEHRAGVVVGERCLIGAHSVIAAGFVEPTTLGCDVALDSSVQVAHNVRIGDRSQLAAHVDLAGHCELGKGVRMGGGSQVAGGVKVGDGATLLASAGAAKDVPAGETWAGFPARPLWEWRRSLVRPRK